MCTTRIIRRILKKKQKKVQTFITFVKHVERTSCIICFSYNLIK